MVRTILSLALSCISLGQVVVVQRPRNLTLTDLETLKTITTTAMSPDGSQVLYTIAESDMARDVRRESIWAINVNGGTPQKILEQEALSSSTPPAWSPDGKQFSYLSKQSGSVQIWLARAASGEATRLTNAVSGVNAFAWAPDGQTISYVVTPAAEPAKNNDGIHVVSATANSPKAELHLIGVESKKDRTITVEGPTPDDLSWSPDNQEIAFAADNDIGVIELKGGKIRELVARPGVDSTPRWSPDGKRIAFVSNYGQPFAKISISVVAADGSAAPQDNYQAFDFGFGGYPPRFLGWSADNKSLYVTVLSGLTQNLYSLSLANGESKRITSGEGRVFHDFSFSRDGRWMAFLMTDPLTPSEVCVSPLANFESRQITSNTNRQLVGINLAKPETVRWKSKDGTEIEGLLLRPYGYDPKKRYPLLVQMEGTYGTYDLSFTGRVSADTSAAVFPFQQQLFAARGYAVLMPNPRGSWGRGEEFRKLGRTDYGLGPYDDIMSGVDYLIAQGIADPDRLGIMGLAFDGYRTAFTITQTDRFKAAAVGQVFGFDLVSWYGQAEYYQGFLERMIGGAPWQVPERYARISPINYAGKIKTPTLIFHFEPPKFMSWIGGQSQEFYSSLKKANVPTEYVIYPTYGNDVRPRVVSDMIRRNLDWFDRWLKTN